ncbi:hypothetical protein C8N43_1557 [Litoreibacter ponti]|uniref:Flp pilus assembly pilin Flp n=1 Tax=Litoreibacter ponti TaxID=1510457 RepID=A0A2T6BLG3_9RHOB|nr:hypothetical protein [Litoreibacter ponti]PTX56892.1 hypothetical protein C8N43_1557 [Litoreibacter ponti]
MKKLIKDFVADETGAFTIPWVAAGGAAAFIGIVAVASIIGGVEKLDEDRGYQLRAQEKVTTF